MADTFNKVGNYGVDANSVSFIKEQPVAIYCVGLRPNTPVNIFFDGVQVNAYCRAASLASSVTSPVLSDFALRSDLGGPATGFTTDSDGVFAAVFYIPPATFFTGDREIIVADIAAATNIASATTSAKIVFKSFNYDPETTDPSYVSTRPSDTQNNVLTNRGTGVSGSRDFIYNPMVIAFYVGPDDTFGVDGLYVTSVDLYFKSKSSTKGVIFDIRTLENGIPTQTVVPLSRVRLAPSSINVSDDGSLATKVTFSGPIYLRAGFEYGISIIPEGGSPDYAIWTAAVGEKDLATGQVISDNWGEGFIYTSTNGTSWVPVQGEFPKFKLYRAQFDSANNVVMTNKDYEFLRIANNIAAFDQGEWVYQDTANSTGTVSCNTGSNILIGSGTTFTTSLSVGNKIVVANATVADVVTVNSIANNTYLTLKEYPRVTANSTVTGNFKIAPVGRVEVYNPNMSEIILDDSNAANSTFKFTTNSNIYGVVTGAVATITGVQDKVVNRFYPVIPVVQPQATSIDFKMAGIKSDYSAYAEKRYDLAGQNYILDSEVVIASKSNEVVYNSGNKSFVANIALSSTSQYLSPVIDMQGATAYVVRNFINNTSYNEHTTQGQAATKYISKRVTLAEGLDSEDIRLMITAYRPANTDIEVYAKILNDADPDAFETKNWSKLDNRTPQTYSDVTNRKDLKEYEFTFTSSPASYPKPGVLAVNTTTTTVRGTGAEFAVQLVKGDVIKVFANSTSNVFNIVRVTNTNIVATGTITTNSATNVVTGIGTNFTSSSNGFVAGAKLYLANTNQVVGIINAISNTTSLTLTTNAFANATNTNSVTSNSFYTDSFITTDVPFTFTSNTAVYERVVLPNAAFKNPQNDGVVRYYAPSGAAYDSYRTFAIKIVLKSDSTYRVPRVHDMRVIALSV